MGWGEARVMLLPTSRELVSEPSFWARTVDGGPVKILRTEPVGRDPEVGPKARLCRDWLEGCGFLPYEEGPRWTRMSRGPIDIFLAIEAGRAIEVTFTFKLNKRSYLSLSEWQWLLAQVADATGLIPVDMETGAQIDPDRSGELLVRHLAWREFATAWGWPSSDAERHTGDVPVDPAVSPDPLIREDEEWASAMLPLIEKTWLLSEVA